MTRLVAKTNFKQIAVFEEYGVMMGLIATTTFGPTSSSASSYLRMYSLSLLAEVARGEKKLDSSFPYIKLQGSRNCTKFSFGIGPSCLFVFRLTVTISARSRNCVPMRGYQASSYPVHVGAFPS